MTTLPHWELSHVYPDLESEEFVAAFESIQNQIGSLEQLYSERVHPVPADIAPAGLAVLLGEVVRRLNALYELAETVRGYIYSFVSTDSRDVAAMKRMSEFDQVWVRVEDLDVRLQAWLGRLGPVLEQAIPLDATAQAHAFVLMEMAEQSTYLMSEDEEGLAAELSLSSVNAWSKLQRTVTSQITVDVEVDGTMQKLSMPALLNLYSHPDEATRRRAYEAENEAWNNVREPLAAAMNGIKGTANTLNQRRGRIDALHAAIDMARIDRATLEAMMDAMEESFPMFRRYFGAKAKLLGKEKLAWWDLFAPVVKTGDTFSWEETRAFVLATFGQFSPDLEELAQRAFDQRWIDAEPREGKAGGGFCMRLPSVKESRILVNYDGSLDDVSTVAHELGHAYHNERAYQTEKTALQKSTPMTLAETASIMCETILMAAFLEQADDAQEELAILEGMLIGDSQIIVDIASRYRFEKEVFERRAQSELSADELCEIMVRAQKATYGNGLDERYLQQYMWTWKPHYYRAGLSFYNFPYAFGLLFGTGLYAIYQQRGESFIQDYKDLLASTGEASAADLATRFDIDIRSQKFWVDSLAVIGQRIDRYCELAEGVRMQAER